MALISSPAQKGQGLVEYALILVLIALVVVAGLSLLGPKLGSVYQEINDLFPGVINVSELIPEPTPEPTPLPTEEPLGSASIPEAFVTFCSTHSTGTNIHIYVNIVTGRYIGLDHNVTPPGGFSLNQYNSCP